MTADVSKATCDILLACAQKAETVSIFYLIDLGWEDFNFIPQTHPVDCVIIIQGWTFSLVIF